MIIKFHLCCILLILVILLLLKFYLDCTKINDKKIKDNNEYKCNCNKNNCNCKAEFNILLNKMKLQTSQKINSAIEQGMIEAFSSNNNNNDDTSPTDYPGHVHNHRIDKFKLFYFYNENSPECEEFMDIWFNIRNNLPPVVLYEEVNIDKTDKNDVNSPANMYNIRVGPVIILLINNKIKKYTGNKNYNEIANFLNKFLKRHNVPLLDSDMSYNKENDKAKLILFYSEKDPQSKKFIDTWMHTINNLPKPIIYEEFEINKTNVSTDVIENNIKNVPKLVLVINNKKRILKVDTNYNDTNVNLTEKEKHNNYIKRSYSQVYSFLARFNMYLMHANIKPDTFEQFADNGYSSISMPPPPPNGKCFNVTFDTQIDVTKDEFLYQIFNSEGQYGYVKGSTKEGSILSPYDAAYSVVDSYLSSLPDITNMNECANLYSNNIRQFGLCDSEKLTEKLSYNDKVQNGLANIRFEGTDYSTNTNIVNAIKSACDL